MLPIVYAGCAIGNDGRDRLQAGHVGQHRDAVAARWYVYRGASRKREWPQELRRNHCGRKLAVGSRIADVLHAVGEPDRVAMHFHVRRAPGVVAHRRFVTCQVAVQIA